MKVVGYVRCSTDRQAKDGYSLVAQERIIRAWAEDAGHEVLTVIPDVMSGAKTTKLHGREAAIRLVEVGLAEGLVVVRYDRATRSTLDGAELLVRARAAGWPILTTDGKSTADRGQMFMTDVELAYAAEERRRIGDRTREGLAARRAKNLPLGRKPRVSAEVEALIAEQHAAGFSARAIALMLNQGAHLTPTGSGVWAHPAVTRVLRRQATILLEDEAVSA